MTTNCYGGMKLTEVDFILCLSFIPLVTCPVFLDSE